METQELATPTAFNTLAQLSGGYCVARCLHVVARLGLADQLEDMPRSTAELAANLGVDADALRRMLRLLSAHGVFEASGDNVRHTAVSRLLRSDHPQSMRSFVEMIGLPVNWKIYEQLEHSLQTGRPASEVVIPEGYWNYFGVHPQENRVFNAAMASKAHAQVAGVLAAYDFSGFGSIADIGGGRGHLLSAILETVPTARGVLFDLPNVVQEAGSLVSERLNLQAGDFFKDPLPACDAYLVMEIIHDWDDAEALKILKAIRRAAPEHARLLLIEQLIATESGPHWSKMLDIHMLALLGGRQRSLQEYQGLLQRTGFRYEREIPTFADISIIEAVPV